MGYFNILCIVIALIILLFKEIRKKTKIEKTKIEKKNRSINDKLIDFGIDVKNFTHEGLENVKLSIDDELKGVSKISGTLCDNNKFFDYLLIYDYKDGYRELCFSNGVTTKRSVRTLVNKLYLFLGYDWEFREKFDSFDLKNIRLGNTMLREWKCDDCAINLHVNLEKSHIRLTVRSKF